MFLEKKSNFLLWKTPQVSIALNFKKETTNEKTFYGCESLEKVT